MIERSCQDGVGMILSGFAPRNWLSLRFRSPVHHARLDIGFEPQSLLHGPSYCRVERWRGGVGQAYPLSGPCVRRCLASQTLLRFHLPLIKPDVRIARIRLSEKAS